MMERHTVPITADQTITLPAEPSSAALARDFVRGLLQLSPHRALEDAALLCVTELVANVACHTGSAKCVIRVVDGPDDLLIEVADETSQPPVLPAVPAGAEAEHGRGLHIIDALAGTWGVRPQPDDGKCIWLRLCPP